MTNEPFVLVIIASLLISYPVFAFIQWKWEEDSIIAIVVMVALVAIFSIVWVLLNFWYSVFFSLSAFTGMILSSMISSWVGKQS